MNEISMDANETRIAQAVLEQRVSTVAEYGVYVGLDVHKDTIAVAVAPAGRSSTPASWGEVANKPKTIAKLVDRLTTAFDGEVILFCYEAGPCGYGLYRQLLSLGHDCQVVAPSLIPRKPGERIKTDRRDALKLATTLRSGDLTAVWVPDAEQEAMRDLTRAREDLKAIERTARQRLGAFLLRHGHVYPGKSRWTQAHFRWIERITMATPVQQIVLQEYVDTVIAAQRRVAALTGQMRQALDSWSLRPVVEALMALRGVQMITAMTVLAELGDLTRFDSPSQLMAYLGLVPSEHSSGGSRRQGSITKTGNGHVRRVLVEAAWAYRFPARKSDAIQRRAEQTSDTVQAIAWHAQKRLCGRYRHLIGAGKNTPLATTAVARELAGFIWAIACEVPVNPAVAA
ncbi:IS110 family transposase [Salinisphaera sp. LB1]|uniref:IS110 family transposase n=1 Tax=Salinisphaera sp. LB1 TaxID=2183911 RepID=UPI000D7EA54A|nr:IS110 family transposase [Salinisphaera sp. LB1]AWN15565.1 Mobile element protein [Salinisphaera sp. LB1]AWN16986.1 Mobile element protein [Salinisphaera sp. LB1]AWN17010.1 Mobile element protein [Salinisphaera sp. LB1]